MTRKTGTVREQILDAAIALLREAGVKKLAQPQVARAAGVPQGHLTYYFPRKFDLLVAVARRFTEMVGGDLQTFVASDAWRAPDLSARARALSFVCHLVKNRERTRMLLGLAVEAEADPALRDALVDCALATRTLVAQVLARPAEDPEVDLAVATLWGLGLQHLIFAGRRTDEQTDALLARLADWPTTAPLFAAVANGGTGCGGYSAAAGMDTAIRDAHPTHDAHDDRDG